MKITNEYNDFHIRYNDFFKNRLVLDLLEDVFLYVTHESLMAIFYEYDDSDILEMLGLNIGEYIKEDLMSVNEKEKIEDDGYTFIYHNSDFFMEYIKKLRDYKLKNFNNNESLLKWNENYNLKIEYKNNDFYMVITNLHIIKYTDENDISISKKNIPFSFINIEHLYIVFLETINNKKLINDFFIIVECYFSDRKKVFLNYSILKDDLEKIDKESVENLVQLLNNEFSNKKFYGWIKDTKTLKVSNA